MTKIPEFTFHKMHGAGNDFVLIDARRQRDEILPKMNAGIAGLIADRRQGIGCDQILLLKEPVDHAHRARYEILNSDGSVAAQCGNGARCIGLYLDMQSQHDSFEFSVESPSGIVRMQRMGDGEYQVNMGEPRFGADSVALSLPEQDGIYRLPFKQEFLEFGVASMGNPHALLTVTDIQDDSIPEQASYIQNSRVFDDGVNVGFAQVHSREHISLRVVERGAGETLACGSGACAAVAILRLRNEVHEQVSVDLPGGRLVIKWRGEQDPLLMKGPAKHVFKGTMNE